MPDPNLLDQSPTSSFESDSDSQSIYSATSVDSPETPPIIISMEATTAVPAPKRGGKMYLGVHVAGCALNIEDKVVSDMSYHCSTFQVRTPKATATAEKTLYDSKLNTSQIKLNGNLELPTESIASAKELDKMDFIRALDIIVSCFGLESFFHLPLTAGKMKYLIDDSHHFFTIQDVMDKHSSRLATTGYHA